jgi:hypothetical protein
MLHPLVVLDLLFMPRPGNHFYDGFEFRRSYHFEDKEGLLWIYAL